MIVRTDQKLACEWQEYSGEWLLWNRFWKGRYWPTTAHLTDKFRPDAAIELYGKLSIRVKVSGLRGFSRRSARLPGWGRGYQPPVSSPRIAAWQP